MRHEQNGLFIAGGGEATAEGLAGQLRWLSAAPELRRQLGAVGREEARSRYDWSRIAGQLEELYQAAEQHAARRYGRKGA